MCARFVSKLKTLIHELICVKNNFYPATIKNENRAAEVRKKLCGAKGTNNSIKLKKGNIGEYKNFRAVPLCSSFFLIMMKLKEFCVTQNDTPKMVKNVSLY